MRRLALLFSCALSLCVACSAKDKDDTADPTKNVKAFRDLDFTKAIAAGKGEKKLVMVDFYADWCGPCKQMDAKTFKQEKVASFLKEKVVAVKIDVDDNQALAKKHKITNIPCLVFFDGEGKEVGRILGFQSADKFMTQAEKITSK